MSFIKELFRDKNKATLTPWDHLRIPFKDIKKATNNFADDCCIGSGGHGKIYKGELVLKDNGLVTVAFKRFHSMIGDVTIPIMKYAGYLHKNMVPLFGYCIHNDIIILVYEYLSNKSLDLHLSKPDLTWLHRLQICFGVARGLIYLHDDWGVLHCDMKSANILLDRNWQAKVADFRLTNFGVERFNFIVSNMIGTIGYVDPLYVELGILTKESDIYSFGVVMLEVLCGRLAVIDCEDERRFLVGLARWHYEKQRLDEIIDPVLKKQMSKDSLNAFSTIAFHCLEYEKEKRPPLGWILTKLEELLKLQQEFEKPLALKKIAGDLKTRHDDEYDSYKVKDMEHMKIPLEDIREATCGFHKDFKIGNGGFGEVYKANLFHFDVECVKENRSKKLSDMELLGFPRRQSIVAIKRLNRRFGQGTPEFLQEISVLPYFRHENLVTLVGFCDEDHERILVYEYASKGSLDKYIGSTDSTHNLSWAQRLQICLNAARGLNFLHDDVGEHHRIIHRDVKSSNILLDQHWKGLISDFGLSRIGPANLQATFLMTQVAGTLEYIDPQYHKTGMLTKESDVYSFGVVLFEVLSGRLARFPKSHDDPEYLPDMVKRCFANNMVNEIVDTKLKKEFNESFQDSVSIFAAIAYKCLKEKRDDRPTMAHVVEELEKAFKTQIRGIEALRISYDKIRSATKNFSDVIDHGEFGKVCKGELSHSKGHSVIAKQLDPSMGRYGEDFYKELALLYSYTHPNVIPLIAFCEERDNRIVVFKHMVNGSLKEHLKNSSLTWKQRLKICVGAAHGLASIHNRGESQYSTHGDIKSNNILLNHDWEAAIYDFILSKAKGTLGYYDPLYEMTGNLTQKSDVYSFGVVLFEVLSGRMAIETIKRDKQLFTEVPNMEPQSSARGESKDVKVVYLAKLAAECCKKQKVDEIIFHDIKAQIEEKSLALFSKIAWQCLADQREDRPTMTMVVNELEKVFQRQDEWEWEQKLPVDYEKIICMSKYPISTTITKKDLHSLLSSGVLLRDQKWFSITMDGIKSEMAPATTFSFRKASHVKWKSIRNSRFPKVAKVSDISDLNIQIQIRPQFLTMDQMYGAYLVFKFCDRRKVSHQPLYVNMKYKMAGETLNSYFTEWEAGKKWLMVELFRFFNNEETTGFEVLLQSLSRYYCGDDIFVEGMQFKPLSVDCEVNKEIKDEKNMQRLFKSELDTHMGKKLANNYHDIIMRSENNIQNASKEELYALLLEGIFIDNGQKLFSLSMVNMKKCHLLPAKAVIYASPNVKCFTIKPPLQSRCRFTDVVEIRSHYEFRIKCNIETRMLSSDTDYACFLVFQILERCHGLECPVKARELLLGKNKVKESNIICFITPNQVNLKHIKWVPKQREDGWMEVVVWKMSISDNEAQEEYVGMDLKLTSFEGSMRGLVVSGIEFRPI